METNVLYYGDNLEILRKYIPDNSMDLIYLDPPFNSKATYFSTKSNLVNPAVDRWLSKALVKV